MVLADWTHPVEWGKVREFARAVHDPRLGREPPVPPLTFPVVLSAEFIERFVSELLPLDRRRTVHGEQDYEYLKPLQVGQVIRCRAKILRDEVKQGQRGGRMRLVTVEVKLTDASSGETVGFERMTAIEQEALTS
ncbi:MAG TPA: MaoC family dehydratase N-terminal domain-containing protein [Aestuariivirgaceae bacterium]|nr:MaoC family dehydratase N-terminal domain-containing protein [Aestuariivirgaceae bacterium]